MDEPNQKNKNITKEEVLDQEESKNDGKVEKVGKTRKKRGEGRDAKKVASILLHYDQKKSISHKRINEMFGGGISHQELKAIIEQICNDYQISFDRQAKRDNRVLHKFLDDRWYFFGPMLENVQIFTENHSLIQGKRQDSLL